MPLIEGIGKSYSQHRYSLSINVIPTIIDIECFVLPEVFVYA
jgi:hypothetical protein